MKISIIIPTYNEAEGIGQLLSFLKEHTHGENTEIIVIDGGSEDNTIAVATPSATAYLSPKKGRAAQMNYGAAVATGDVLYFLHADTYPPKNFIAQVAGAVRSGFGCGCFRLSFDYQHWFLEANCWFTRFNINAVRFGDQSLFVKREVFQKSGGFREDLLMMEDQEIIHRLRKHGKFKVMNDVAVTSARKYLDNGVYRMQGIFYRIWALYYLGYSQSSLLKLHRRLIRKHKL